MNLQLVKIQRQNAFDYSLLSEFMKKKNGKLIFTAGFGNAGQIRDNTNKNKLNLMQKFERNFQIQSIIKSYNEAFHINPKQLDKNWTPEKDQRIYPGLFLPRLNKEKETRNIKYFKINPNATFNQFHNKTLLRNSSISYGPNLSMYGSTKKFNNNTTLDNNNNNNDNSIDYNNYFYHTIDCFPQGTSTSSDKDFNSNMNKCSSTSTFFNNNKRNKKLLRNISQDCIYLFGQNKIIYRNKNDKSRNNDILGQKPEIQKTPFIDYSKEFNPYKTKYKLKKNFEFYKDKTKAYENFSEIKQEYIFKIRKMFENKKNVKYHFEYLPSHKTVKTMVRKNKIFDLMK